MRESKIGTYITILYCFASVALFLYSYTQVDLNLTLSRVSLWQIVQKKFQYIGFYMRPTSAYIYLGILAVFFILYFIALRLIEKNYISKQKLWHIIGIVTIILIFSYPAFSYDIFNYMFTAKTVVLYQKNPYSVIPLDFLGVDPWLTFMRWTHLPSAYTPLWIFLTLPAYVLGFGYFLLILWNIKVLVAVFYLVAAWMIGRILTVYDPKRAVLGTAIFALNPLVIIESLVSSHNDILMMAVVLTALFLYIRKRTLLSWFVITLSVALKLMTIFLLPVYLFGFRRSHALIAILVGFFLVILQREVLPWYWIWVMPFIALLPQMRFLTTLAGGVSIGLLLRYVPFLYFGHWNDPVPFWKMWLSVIPIVLFSSFVLFQRIVWKTRQ